MKLINNIVFLKQASSKTYYNISEAAEALGIQRETLRNYLWEGKFTTYRFKSLTLIAKKEVEEWIVGR